MARPFFVLLSLSLVLSACTQRLICPAYQSAYIYDQEELRKKFSYFQEDSTPKMLTASKTKYLIAEPVSYRKKLRSMQTVAMKDVNPVLPDSMKIGEEGLMGEEGEDGVVPGAELDLAARSVIDSTYIEDVPQDTTEVLGDSAYVISKDKEVRLLKYNRPDSVSYDETTGRYVPKTPKYAVADVRFNVEQDNYMWYLRKNIILPDVRLSANMAQEQEKAAKKKDKKGGFFKNLFKRKKKDAVDSTEIIIPPKPKDDFDYIDEDEQTQPQEQVQEEPQKKKGMFSFLKKKEKTDETSAGEQRPIKEKKKKKEKKPKVDNGDTPKDQEEDEDDGF